MQRVYKPNPVMQTRDAATKRRRDMFFRRVQNKRDDKKWEARGEQVCDAQYRCGRDPMLIYDQLQQLDFVAERRRWEAEKARQAPPEHDDFDEQALDDSIRSEGSDDAPHLENGMTEADYIAAQEEYEFQQLIASMEQENDASSQHYGSDDDDYDSIFMACANTVDGQYHQQAQYTNSQLDDLDTMDVDMTDG